MPHELVSGAKLVTYVGRRKELALFHQHVVMSIHLEVEKKDDYFF